MARKVFFSFHYDRDTWRVSQVRNSNLLFESPPFLDGAAWEAIKRKGATSVKAWIDSQLHGTSVTCVLIGNQTSTREWVHYEIQKSFTEGKGLLGIYIHNVKHSDGQVDRMGGNPFDVATVPTEFGALSVTRAAILAGRPIKLYDWVRNAGSARDWQNNQNFASWVEGAAKEVGR
ncbi:MAG: TIR domain-containing protein [Myxococcales bacterium]|nr:TIR domain-containing protein [Myxococcales bacterium]